MGMYTGIRFKGYVKPEFRSTFESIAIHGEWESSDDTIFKEFGKLRRAIFIPCGALCYMPHEWETGSGCYDPKNATDGFERSYNKETGYWTFQCSLKNYNYEIEKWFSILPYFIEKIDHLEYFYEEWNYSTKYDLVDGKVKEIDDKFIQYGYEEDKWDY